MHHRYEPTSFSRHPAMARAAKVLVAVAIGAAVVAAWSGAGRGNGWQPPRERVAVTLPPVTVVGDRATLAATDVAPVATCERTAAATPRAARKA